MRERQNRQFSFLEYVRTFLLAGVEAAIPNQCCWYVGVVCILRLSVFNRIIVVIDREPLERCAATLFSECCIPSLYYRFLLQDREPSFKMKLSLVFELLLIFVLIAFAASKSVKYRKNDNKDLQKDTETEIGQIEDSSINKYCKCVDAYCNCCRDFALPLVNLNGPGCATLTYLNGDKMAVSLSFGKKVITNRTLSSKKPSPVCMPLPGGISKFCGRVYNIARKGEDFRACLGLELQSKSAVEAAVRVSCFKFGSKGVTSEPADPLPLIPDEKGEDEDDDDDDDDDDFGLGADDDDEDDDDDEESELDAVNDVESADYTGFSLLGEDLLGDLFGTSGGKKPNKNKKKQAPLPSTTTTRRPRPTRRPARRPNTRTTTNRPIRTTTVRIRPGPNRRPARRTTRKPTTASIEEISSSIQTTVSTTSAPSEIPVTTKILPDKKNQITSVSDETFETIVAHRAPSTTVKSVTNFDDPGLEMSLAHITGQLSSMPVIPLKPNDNDDKGSSKVEKEMAYEKVQIITPKPPVAIADDNISDDMVQIVQSLDSAEETVHDKEILGADETRGFTSNYGSINSGAYEGLSLPRKKHNDDFQLEDLDILDLTNIGESIGDQLGIFGGKKRDNRHTKEKVPDYSDYHEVVDTMEDALLMARNNKGKNKNKKDRRRQNKMMRGEWSQV